MDKQGLYKKYNVERADGKPIEWCFVLDKKDPAIEPILRKIIECYLRDDRKALAMDLIDQFEGVTGKAFLSLPNDMQNR